ncbi:bifunctional DNA-formamidopyrimidine glycosylase/DNA-(apurinic or apyrimidinic site) lyase [Microvirga tunisiensis]|uniref:Formamidopyrimidine-DNA glycosylase n=1 Tax=Pannonibacter tanglangensis TaxID=2750084 RepID=A0A7X5F7T5_9HYPH|nr:bifunctional DNA-formamidopyrimidine glycosylase/DNA-(apurinic or apyrimidinic site) lyase [Pannonibacter sp. XCT-53]NBN80049.1 bifunctional DNA-formamidopyrimidine glycosylase/DNA-(apurinic or apyrimidinic site) lyase [Pannonibacter sp. XCT-53]
MPELPEVETVRRGLAPSFEGARILRLECHRPDLRFPFPDRFAERVEGRRVAALSRRAKYLLADLDDGEVVVMHLGMSGSFRVEAAGESHLPGEFTHARSRDEKHDHVVFHLSAPGADGDTAVTRIVYNDPRRFGFMQMVRRADLAGHPLFARMGLEPLGNRLDGEVLDGLFRDKRTPLKAALLDQRLIAGLGNIYVCEALWRSGLSPERAAGEICGPQRSRRALRETLARSIREVLEEAILAGGSTLRDHAQTDGTLGYFQHSFAVYGREGEPCRTPGCRGTVARLVQAGRSTFHCPSCQR